MGKGSSKDVVSSNHQQNGSIGKMIRSQYKFAEEAREIVRAVNESRDKGGYLSWWKLVERGEKGICYLEHEPLHRRCIECDEAVPREVLVGNNDLAIEFENNIIPEDEDLAIIPQEDDRNETAYNLWFFSIVYSDTWDCPVLYFRVEHLDGSLVSSRDDVVKQLKALHHQNQVEDTWDFVSFDEHPVLGLPSYFLHPCQTKERMQLLLLDFSNASSVTGINKHATFSRHYLLSWMSMIFPAVGLSLPSATFVALHDRFTTPSC